MDALRLLTTNVKFRHKPVEEEAEKKEELKNELFSGGKVKITGSNPIDPVTEFPDCIFKDNLEKQYVQDCSAIQRYSIPILSSKRDLLACAPTGSGKTIAYLFPILYSLQSHVEGGYRALIIAPTKDLCEQIYKQAKRLTVNSSVHVTELNKSNEKIQEKSPQLRERYDVCITTPMRLIHALRSGLKLDKVEFVVMDEADRLFEEGFVEQTDEILSACTNPNVCKSLFSATLPSTVEELAQTVARDPLRVIIGTKDTSRSIDQKLLFVGSDSSKVVIFRQMIANGEIKPRIVVFVQDIERAKALYTELMFDEIHVGVIHGELPEVKREEVLNKFRKGDVWVLIATDLLARGIDFHGVKMVINFDFPQSVHSYIHRIGRTGRAGHAGKAITFFTKEDSEYVKLVAGVMKASGCEVPSWILSLPKPSKGTKKKLKKSPPKRKKITTRASYDRHKELRKKEHIKKLKRDASLAKQKGKEGSTENDNTKLNYL
ncbi:ATP-dependent RNA helicase Rok1 [Schizosaccharomyces cryophilus OY26]|uniref:RNA helicase n=1 Tax=Schizosaccharomyces cryophilus (strain OY26 / ATCC MYA-4695 / CBS 11777 / NBRC 106824 / NRRL Y48691) TaxID=653667 RepID=S9W6N7_SCHCR|nr:ATP-dependent RNA helicase Rok1 [Schizosaccharomyces cryophilus OY26]EPY54204.1 ATP-dependent RNA helicase Rok1 [Schizosaccharomyces cryophilus OY26]